MPLVPAPLQPAHSPARSHTDAPERLQLAASSGWSALWLAASFGCFLTTACSGDDGASDTSAADTGASDAGASDTTDSDTGTSDTGASDTGASDTSAAEADTEPGADASDPDSGPQDTGALDTTPPAPTWPADAPRFVGGARPARVVRPPVYDPDASYPLVVLLHGFGATGTAEDLYLGVSALSDDLGFLLVIPDGTVGNTGERYWNATPACCAFASDPPDDVAYLSGLVDEMKAGYRVDDGRVYVLGHSNGGFMGYRLLCEASERFTAVASLAGANFLDPADCAPAAQPVSLLQVHGTDDETIAYEGGSTLPSEAGGYPSARQSVSQAAITNGCEGSGEQPGPALDMMRSLPGDETATLRWPGCPAGVTTELWTIAGGTHIPILAPNGTRLMLEWLLAQDRTP